MRVAPKLFEKINKLKAAPERSVVNRLQMPRTHDELLVRLYVNISFPFQVKEATQSRTVLLYCSK
jgi:hypothetical protein